MSARRSRQRVLTGRSNASASAASTARRAKVPPAAPGSGTPHYASIPSSPIAASARGSARASARSQHSQHSQRSQRSQRSTGRRSVMSAAGRSLTASASAPNMAALSQRSRGADSSRSKYEHMYGNKTMYRSRRAQLNATAGPGDGMRVTFARTQPMPEAGAKKTRTQLLAERRLKDREMAHKAADDQFHQSLAAYIDIKERMKQPDLMAATTAPVSPRTMATIGTKQVSNKSRSTPAYLPPDAPAGIANWTAKPKFPNQSSLHAFRKAEMKPPISYDFNGDGYVDDLEYFIGCRLDTNKDGRIDTAERREGKKLLQEMHELYTFGLEAAGPVIYSDIVHRVSDAPELNEEANKRLAPPWEVTPRRSLHLTARKVDPTRSSMGRPDRRVKEEQHALGSGDNLLEKQAGAVGTGVQQKNQLQVLMDFL